MKVLFVISETSAAVALEPEYRALSNRWMENNEETYHPIASHQCYPRQRAGRPPLFLPC